MTFKVVGDTLTKSSPDGTTHTAKFGRPAVIQSRDVAHTLVTVVKAAPDKIIGTDSRGGKIATVFTITLSPDGKSLRFTNEDKKGDEVDKFTATRQ